MCEIWHTGSATRVDAHVNKRFAVVSRGVMQERVSKPSTFFRGADDDAQLKCAGSITKVAQVFTFRNILNRTELASF
jgi:hypothetical protein